jgi:threonine dehydratase
MTNRALIAAAARTIAPFIRTTPVLSLPLREAAALGAPGGLSLKLELLQHAGSFKPRGAFNRILSAAPAPGSAVVAASGGNHGAAVAFAATQLGLRAEIFVPELSSAPKRARIKSLGATLHVGGATYPEALAASEAFLAQHGGLSVHAYDMVETIAGQGTCGREFELQAPDLDSVLVASGGGGFIAGIAAWYAGAARIVSVEPEACPCLHAARAAGQPLDAAVGGLAADSLGARRLGSLAWPIVQAHVADSVLVPDAAIKEAQVLLWDRFRLMVEPGGATALAALLCGAYRPAADERVGVLVCGGNVDPATVTGG